jgi:hypothetical protein
MDVSSIFDSVTNFGVFLGPELDQLPEGGMPGMEVLLGRSIHPAKIPAEN